MCSASANNWLELIERQFPALRPASAVVLGEGCDSVAVEVDGELVFRFPKRDDVEQQLFIEARVLAALAPTSPVPLPQFHLFGIPTSEFARHFVGYPKLPGRPALEVRTAAVAPTPLAPALGSFLSWLHSYPVDDAEACGVPRQSLEALINEARSDALDDLALVAQVAPDAPIDAIRRVLDDVPEACTQAPVLVHNDFAAEHVLVDAGGQHITGVIDWSDVAIGDPAADFAGIWHWGGSAFADAVLATYRGPVYEGLHARARFLALCRGVGDVRFGHEFGKPEYIRAGLRALEM
jgi:aminoglycoside phosphotransferase (APT) family kinase protein